MPLPPPPRDKGSAGITGPGLGYGRAADSRGCGAGAHRGPVAHRQAPAATESRESRSAEAHGAPRPCGGEGVARGEGTRRQGGMDPGSGAPGEVGAGRARAEPVGKVGRAGAGPAAEWAGSFSERVPTSSE